MTKPTMQWKHSEKTIARMLGARRIGNTGQSTPDAMNDHLCVEVKHRRRAAVPAWMAAALDKVRSQAGPQRLGLVVVHREGQRYGEAFVLMRLQDFADWYVSPMAGASDEEIAVLAPDQLEGVTP